MEYNLEKLKYTIENMIIDTNNNMVENTIRYSIKNGGNNMPTIIHHQTELKLDINSSDLIKDVTILISDTLNKVWSQTYLADLDIDDYIELVVDLWVRHYIESDKTKEAINKIKSAQPPKNLTTYLVFNLFDDEDNLIIDHSEMSTTPLFRTYLLTKDLWDTYIYANNKFESLEIIDPAYIDEIKQEMSLQDKMTLDETILQAYGFHNRLLGRTPKRIRLYTAQPPNIIESWNRKGIIPKKSYFTDSMERTEYYWKEGDIIVDYKLPENDIVVTSEIGGAKEYVTINDIKIL